MTVDKKYDLLLYVSAIKQLFCYCKLVKDHHKKQRLSRKKAVCF